MGQTCRNVLVISIVKRTFQLEEVPSSLDGKEETEGRIIFAREVILFPDHLLTLYTSKSSEALALISKASSSSD